MPGRYVTDAIYDRLRSIGVSVETADALAPVVAGLSPRKREAFFLWAMGMNNCEVANKIGCDEKTIRNMVKNIRKLL
jgi:DNA-binding CsgD family transcriptional regulator